jgi:hypothetical protein
MGKVTRNRLWTQSQSTRSLQETEERGENRVKMKNQFQSWYRVWGVLATLVMALWLTMPAYAQQSDTVLVINEVIREESDSGSIAAQQVALDAAGNRYVFGSFNGNVTFGEGRNGVTRNGTDNDLFVAKYDADGNLQWVQEFETSLAGALPSAQAAAIGFEQGFNHLYVAGTFRGRLDVGSTSLLSGSEADGFVAQLNPQTGVVQWVNQLIGTQPLIVRDLSANSGNVVVTGRFTGIGEFPGQFQTKKTLLSLTAGGEDMFAVLYSPVGQTVFAVQAGGDGAEGSGIYMDKGGSFTVVGDFFGTVRFPDTFNPRQLTSQGGRDAFVARYNSNAQLRFVTRIGGPDSNSALHVVQKRIDLYVAVSSFGQTTFGSTTLTSRGENDTFIVRISTLDGSVQRVIQIGSNNTDFLRGLAADSEDLQGGNIFVSGRFFGPQLTIGTGADAIVLNKVGSVLDNAYLTGIRVDGGVFTPSFGQVVQGKFNSNRVTVDSDSTNVYLAGGYTSAVTFGEGNRTISLPAPTGSEAMAVAHFAPDSGDGGGDDGGNDDLTVFYISLTNKGTVDGIRYSDEDVLAFSTLRQQWTLLIDGSDIGLGPTGINAFHWLPDGTMLLSVNKPVSLPGLGTVDDSDIVRFIPETLGANTSGTFELFLRGADVGLTTNDEDIDAIAIDPSGRLVISTLGNATVPGANGNLSASDEDLLVLNGDVWELLFDGSDVGLTDNSEGIVDAWIDTQGFTLATLGAFSMDGLSGAAGDIFRCQPTSTGENTQVGACEIVFSASAHGLAGKTIDAFSIGRSGVMGTEFSDDDGLAEEPDDDDDSADAEQQIFLPLISGE